MARKNKNNSGSNVAVVFYKTENSEKNKNNKSRVKKVNNAATALKRKGEVVTVDSVLKQLDEVRLKDGVDGGSNEEDKDKNTTVRKSKKGSKLTEKVVRKTLQKLKKNKKRSSDDGGVTGNKGRKY